MATDAQPEPAARKPKRRWPQFSISTLLLLMLVCAVGLGAYALRGRGDAAPKRIPTQSQPAKQAKAKTQEGPALRLRIDNVPIANAKSTRIKIEVRNVGTEAVGWDKEFSMLLDWRVVDWEGLSVPPKSDTPIEPTADQITPKRFQLLQPGERLTSIVDLNTGVRRFTWYSAILNDPIEGEYCADYGNESISQYDIRRVPVTVQLIYHTDSGGAFFSLFGYDPSSVRLFEGKVESNTIGLR